MRYFHTSLCSASILTVFTACSSGSGPENGMPASKAEEEVAVACDPIVEEYRDLLADYENGLQDMVAAEKVDKEAMERFESKAKAISKELHARGEKEIGMRCWNEFNTIGQTYSARISKLAIELSMIEMGDKMDPAAREAMKKAMGQ